MDAPVRCMIRSATISTDGRYRYRLRRQWAPGTRTLPWLMLNPSTADAVTDDPTIRRVITFSREWGYDACDVVNLFAYRSTDPAALSRVDDPIGPRNVRSIGAAIADAAKSGTGEIVLAWGRDGDDRLRSDQVVGGLVRRLVAVVEAAWTAAGMVPVHLGVTAAGAPRHPLYVRAAVTPQPFDAATATRRTAPVRACVARR